MINILIFGYYNNQNWGDDVFEHVFKEHIFKDEKYNLTFKNLNDLNQNTNIYKSIDKVIIGGGDIINDYFFNDTTIQQFKEYFSDKPIYFVGVGITYPNAINAMDFGDYFFIRNKKDFNLVKKRYTHKYVDVIPDIAFNLLNEESLDNFTKTINTDIVKNIGISLPNIWISKGGINNQKLLNDICDMITYLSTSNNVHLIPFDTSDNNDNSDVYLLDKIKNQLKDVERVFYIEKTNISTSDMIEYYKNLDIVIGGRFHSIILSIITQTPFISLYSSDKIDNLKHDLGLRDDYNHLFIKMETNNDNLPITFNLQRIIKSMKYINGNYENIVRTLSQINVKNLKQINEFNFTIQTIIDDNPHFRLSPPQFVSANHKQYIIITTISSILRKIFNKISLNDIDYVLKGYPILNILPKTNAKNLESFKKLITEEILWNITGDPYAPYYYGLYDNIFNNMFLKQLNWIIDDYYNNYYYKQINEEHITLINKNFQKLHRSGWQYIVDNIVLDLNTGEINNPLVIDTYIDKTFHWNKEFYKSKGVIPYKKDWIGFIHHTYSDYDNSFNCIELFKEPLFIESLRTCKCLIVMTEYLTTQIKTSLLKLNIINVDVVTIVHPTEFGESLFDWDLFMNNKNRKVVQIGNWLRDVFSIYRVTLPESSIITQKSILQNKNSENYFPPTDLLDTLYNTLNTQNITNNSIDICRNSFSNMHMKGLYNCIVDMEKSVQVISYLDNTEYDKLLCDNIVFLNLVDASACNTLIECITRNTPIIINPLPAVVELLGEDYPLYYNNYYDVSKILDNQDIIKQAHIYLSKMNKKSYSINAFIESLSSVIKKHTC